MKFLQTIEYRTTRIDEVEKLLDQFKAATEGTRTTERAVVGRDRERPDTYVTVVEFPSYEDAMRNNELPETAHFAEQMAKLCDDVTFTNLDVIREDIS
jgi:quinol monooxygenase YgiN